MLYFEQTCPKATLSGAKPDAEYHARWYSPRTGKWLGEAATALRADAEGRIVLGSFPDGTDPSQKDWALKLVVVDAR